MKALDELRRAAPLDVESRAGRLLLPAAMGGHEQTGIAGVLLGRRVRPRPDQEARAHAARQGRRPHAPHRSTLRAQTGVVFLTYRAVGRGRRHRARASARRRRSTTSRPTTACRTRSGGSSRRGRQALVRRLRPRPRALHRRRPPPRGERRAGAGRAPQRRRARRSRHPSSPSRSPTTRCRSCPTTASSRTCRADAGGSSWRRCGRGCRCATAGRDAVAQGRGRDVPRRPLVHARSGRRRRQRRRSASTSLDVALLQRARARAAARIGDVRTDKRIDFVGGARGTAALEQAVDSGRAAVAFSHVSR